MELTINPNGIWYHGSNQIFTELRERQYYHSVEGTCRVSDEASSEGKDDL